MPSLTHLEVENALPREKPYRLFDGRGVYLEVQPSGSRYWRFKYRFGGRETRISLGTYPETSIKVARERCEQARQQLALGIDPAVARKSKDVRVPMPHDTFEEVAREWFALHLPRWSPSHSARNMRRLELYVFPWIGLRPICQLRPMELLTAVRRIESRGINETAHRTLQICGQVLRYSVATRRIERDFSRDLVGALAPVEERHYPSITDPHEVGLLLQTIEEYNGALVTKAALRLAPLVFVRPGELRKAEWPEFNFETNEWRIPAERMKMRTQHIVPLSTQSVAVLKELYPLTGGQRYVFPGPSDKGRPMSENTINAALRRLGYARTEMTGHGFRSMASTLLNEQGWNRDAIERQLAHAERNSIRAAYNYAEFLPERRRMMQSWADYLDQVRTKSERQLRTYATPKTRTPDEPYVPFSVPGLTRLTQP